MEYIKCIIPLNKEEINNSITKKYNYFLYAIGYKEICYNYNFNDKFEKKNQDDINYAHQNEIANL